MPVYETTVTDRSNVPVAGAKGYIYVGGVLAELTDDLGTPLGNPITSDAFGYAKATVPNRDFTVKWSWLGTIRLIETYIEGGVDSTLRTDLALASGASLIGVEQGGTVQEAVGVRAERLRALALLRDGMARTGLIGPALDTTDFAIAAQSSTTAIVTGTNYFVKDGYDDLFTFGGAVWSIMGTFPQNQVFTPITRYSGNGTDPLTQGSVMPGASVRFFCEAPQLEIYFRAGNNQGGFRIKVDGKYVRTGVYGNTETSNLRYGLITWGNGSATYRKKRLYELEFGTSGGFGGIRTAPIYAPRPAPQPDGLRLLMHGDSRLVTVVESGTATENRLWGQAAVHLGNLLGQFDQWTSHVGGSGWIAPQSPKTLSWFNDRVTIDVVNHAPDVIIETGGANDQSFIVAYGQANYQALVETWLDTVISAKPETVIFMTGPLPARGNENANATTIAVRNAKAAAAATYPENVVFLDNIAEEWMTGTGYQTATNNSGQSDWVTGSDQAHYTVEGNWWIADRIAHAVAGAIPDLIAANAS